MTIDEAQELYNLAKKVCNEDENPTKGLKLLRRALTKLPDEEDDSLETDKLRRRLIKQINKLEEFLADEEEEEVEEVKVEASETSNQSPRSKAERTLRSNEVDVEGFPVKRSVYDKLYEYQRDGLQWMLKLYNIQMKKETPKYRLARGMILADDMGLGKTVQTVALLSTLMLCDEIKCVIIVAPTSLLSNWEREFRNWYKGSIRILRFHEQTPSARLKALRGIQNSGGVLLTTYDLCRNWGEEMNRDENREEFVWDYLVLDEAHKIKNATKTTKSMFSFNAVNKLAITGTPVQNNLKELHTIFNFVNGCLGSYTDFRIQFEDPIVKARKKGASDMQIAYAAKLADKLRAIYQPYFLRRTKNEVGLKLPEKFDWVIWIPLTQGQLLAYEDILKSETVRYVLQEGNKKSALVELTYLKSLCDHPRRLPYKLCKAILENGKAPWNLSDIFDENGERLSVSLVDTQKLIQESSKMKVLVHLMKALKRDKHRALIFSRSTYILDIIQSVLRSYNFKLSRLDGSVHKMEERDSIVSTFQQDNSIDACLLTSQVGGVGLTLTGADRVIIFDPDWNPANDSQAIDRAYRIGQTKHVIVYRLITCGSVEEKIFRRQVYKTGFIEQMVQFENDPTRYFSNEDLFTLFEFNFRRPHESETYNIIEEKHGDQRKPCPLTDNHREELLSSTEIYGISNHKFLYSKQEEEAIITAEESQAIDQNIDAAIIGLERLALEEGPSGTSKNRPFEGPTKTSKKPYNVSELPDFLQPKPISQKPPMPKPKFVPNHSTYLKNFVASSVFSDVPAAQKAFTDNSNRPKAAIPKSSYLTDSTNKQEFLGGSPTDSFDSSLVEVPSETPTDKVVKKYLGDTESNEASTSNGSSIKKHSVGSSVSNSSKNDSLDIISTSPDPYLKHETSARSSLNQTSNSVKRESIEVLSFASSSNSGSSLDNSPKKELAQNQFLNKTFVGLNESTVSISSNDSSELIEELSNSSDEELQVDLTVSSKGSLNISTDPSEEVKF